MNNRNLTNINKINSVCNIASSKLEVQSSNLEAIRNNSNNILRICPANINKY